MSKHKHDGERTEFGLQRNRCACNACKANCRFVPGFLLPTDLDFMIPKGQDPFQWAERNLLASPSSMRAMKDGFLIELSSLVPATKPDGSCIHYDQHGRCTVWENSPFGCAFFSCRMSKEDSNYLVSRAARMLIEATPDSLYRRVFKHLESKGLISPSVIVKRKRMKEAGWS